MNLIDMRSVGGALFVKPPICKMYVQMQSAVSPVRVAIRYIDIPLLLRSRYENPTPNLCWVFCALLVSCAINKGSFFRDCIFVVVDTLLPRFEALGYVLPHSDELTHVAIRGSSAFISPGFR